MGDTYGTTPIKRDLNGQKAIEITTEKKREEITINGKIKVEEGSNEDLSKKEEQEDDQINQTEVNGDGRTGRSLEEAKINNSLSDSDCSINLLDHVKSKNLSDWEESLLSQSYRILPDGSYTMSNNNSAFKNLNNEQDNIIDVEEAELVHYYSNQKKKRHSESPSIFKFQSEKSAYYESIQNEEAVSIQSGSNFMQPTENLEEMPLHRLIGGEQVKEELSDAFEINLDGMFHMDSSDGFLILEKIDGFLKKYMNMNVNLELKINKSYESQKKIFNKKNQLRSSITAEDKTFQSSFLSIVPKHINVTQNEKQLINDIVSDFFFFLPLHLIDLRPEESLANLEKVPTTGFDMAFEVYWYLYHCNLMQEEVGSICRDVKSSAKKSTIRIGSFPPVSNSFPCSKNKKISVVRSVLKTNGTVEEDKLKQVAKAILGKVCAKIMGSYAHLIIADITSILRVMKLGEFVKVPSQVFEQGGWRGECLAVEKDTGRVYWGGERQDKYQEAEWFMLGGRDLRSSVTASVVLSSDDRCMEHYIRSSTDDRLDCCYYMIGVGELNGMSFKIIDESREKAQNCFICIKPDIFMNSNSNKIVVEFSHREESNTSKADVGSEILPRKQESREIRNEGEEIVINHSVSIYNYIAIYCTQSSSTILISHSTDISILPFVTS